MSYAFSGMGKLEVVFVFSMLVIASCQQKSGGMIENSLPESRSNKNPYYSRTDTTTLHLSDAVWKTLLPDSVFRVARKKATEKAFKGTYWNFTGVGTYYCVACGNKLFRSDAKFASECGWPTFYEPSRKNSVSYQDDNSYGMKRTEVLCGRCGSHLGHLFKDGPPPSHNRYCMNSIVLEFVPELTIN